MNFPSLEEIETLCVVQEWKKDSLQESDMIFQVRLHDQYISSKI